MGRRERVKWNEVVEIKNGRNQKAVEDINGQYPIYGSGGIMGYANNYLCLEKTVIIGRKGNINKPIYVTEKFWNVDTAFGLSANRSKLLPKYLYYFCVAFNFEKLNTTVTIPSLTKSNLLNIEILLPPLEAQKQLAKTLDTAAELLSMRKQQLAELNILIKSTFYDMFGNPMTNEKGWEVKQLSTCCTINPRKSEINYFLDDFQVSFVAMPGVSANGDIDTTEIRDYKEVKIGFTYFYENDVLFAKITPCMENGKGAIARSLKNNIGFGSTEFHVLRPMEGVSNSEWLYHLTALPVFRKNAEKNMSGSAGQKRVPTSFLDKFMVSLPPLSLQTQFASIVTKIEEQKALVKKAIDETQYLFDSLMSEYFE